MGLKVGPQIVGPCPRRTNYPFFFFIPSLNLHFSPSAKFEYLGKAFGRHHKHIKLQRKTIFLTLIFPCAKATITNQLHHSTPKNPEINSRNAGASFSTLRLFDPYSKSTNQKLTRVTKF